VNHVYHLYVVRVQRRDELRAFLKANAIGTAIHYPAPIHLQPAYQGRVAIGRGLPETEQVCGQILSLPMHPHMTDDQATYVSERIADWYEQRVSKPCADLPLEAFTDNALHGGEGEV
jgi:dTDP-4-amino-4,6-dideoxygalactose transaminase